STFGRPVHLGNYPIDYGPVLLRRPFRFHLTVDTLPSEVQQAVALGRSWPYPAFAFGRGRDADRSAPPAQTRAGATNAHGSYLGYLASKRSASRTRSSPLVPVPWLGVQFGLGCPAFSLVSVLRSEEHTSELQSRGHLVC